MVLGLSYLLPRSLSPLLHLFCAWRPNCVGIHAIAEKTMAPHSSTLAWKIPWMEEPGGLQSRGSQRVGHD